MFECYIFFQEQKYSILILILQSDQFYNMEKIIQEAFITTPILRSQPNSQNERKLSLNLRQKIMVILRGFSDRQIVFQGVYNIGIPKSFIDINYVQTRPEQQMNKIYLAICTLKKQIQRIKRHSDSPIVTYNMLSNQSKKTVELNVSPSLLRKSKSKRFLFIKKEITPDQKIRLAIQKQLKYRQNLENREKKGSSSEKQKKNLLEKRKQVANDMNKKAFDVYQRQKQKQYEWLDKIQQNNLIQQNQNKQSCLLSLNRNYTASYSKRQQNYDLVKGRMQKQKQNYQLYLEQHELKSINRDYSFKQFKHKRLSSLNQRSLHKQLKSQQVRQRKINTQQQEQNVNLKKWLQKQQKIKQHRSFNKSQKNNRNSESLRGTSTNLMASVNLLRNSGGSSYNSNQFQEDSDNEKQNQILQKIAKRNQKRQMILKSKVQRMRQKHRKQQLQRQFHKKSQRKSLTQSTHNNDSFICQKEPFQNNPKSIFNQTQVKGPNPQEQNIKKKHSHVLANISCDQNMMRLRKLPKHILEKNLKDLRNKELNHILAQNIVQFLK